MATSKQQRIGILIIMIVMVVGTLGGFVAPIAMGYLITVSHGYLSTFVFLALAMVVAGLAILPLAMKPRATLRDAA